jgi:hypothetical protein
VTTRAAGARRPRRLNVIWGRVRPGSGARRVSLRQATSAGGAFRAVGTAAQLRKGVIKAASVAPVETDAGGFFVRFAPYVRRARYRFDYSPPAGEVQRSLAVAPDVCSGRTKQKKLSGAGADEF